MTYKIRQIRHAKKLTQEQLAKLSGVSRATISGLENEKIKITTTSTLIKIADAMDCGVNDIFLS